MNTPNNRRKRDSQKKMLDALINQLKEKELNKITVTDICKEAHVNRTTFYANYMDIYDLAEKLKKNLELEVANLYTEERGNNAHNYLKLFYHIKDNPDFYKTYFMLDADIDFKTVYYDKRLAEEYYGNKHIEYHIEFFRNGFNAVVKKWLAGGCKESAEEIAEVIRSEYENKHIL